MSKRNMIINFLHIVISIMFICTRSYGLAEITKKNTIGFSVGTIYPEIIGKFGIGAETTFRHTLNNHFYYTISLGYGVAYNEKEGGHPFTHAVTTSTIDHYANYLLTYAFGLDLYRSATHRVGCSMGFAGSYSSTMFFKYAYRPLDGDDYHDSYFIPQMIEGYDIGLLGGLTYAWSLTDRLGIQFDARYIIFNKYKNQFSSLAGIFYRF
jgi:hypothetical protein